jgi:hypothetical protein
VCISHATGAGGEEIGRLVAEQLGFLYVDEEIVARAAARGGVAASEVADEERRKSLVARALEALGQGGGEAWALGAALPVGYDELTGEDIRGLIREVIEQTAARGRAVIVAHAASHAVPPGADALRVLVTASPDVRAERVGSRDGLDPGAAARAVRQSDAGRRDYLKRFYGLDEELPTHYDLVVNTDTLSAERAAELVSHAAAQSAAGATLSST